jgi:hypothetical protein
MINVDEFVSEYSKAISDRNAAVLAGAGLSIPAGLVNWKELIPTARRNQSIGREWFNRALEQTSHNICFVTAAHISITSASPVQREYFACTIYITLATLADMPSKYQTGCTAFVQRRSIK